MEEEGEKRRKRRGEEEREERQRGRDKERNAMVTARIPKNYHVSKAHIRKRTHEKRGGGKSIEHNVRRA